jgi:signal peptidase I
MTNTANAAEPAKPAKKHGAVAEMVEIIKTVVYALLIALVLRVLLFQPYTIPSASEEPNLYRGDYIIVSKWSYGWSHHSIPFSPPLFKGRIFFTPPKRGDVVVFKLPSSGHIDYIKRLIGLPGDRIQVTNGHLLINGTPVQEAPAPTPQPPLGIYDPSDVKGLFETNPEGRSYQIQVRPPSTERPGDNTGVYVVPPHCYFMMGDNRDNSADSRFDSGLPPGDPKLGGCAWDGSLDAAVLGQTGVGFVPEENLVGKAQIILLSWNTGPDENNPAGASLFKPWTWFTDARPGRFFRLVH